MAPLKTRRESSVVDAIRPIPMDVSIKGIGSYLMANLSQNKSHKLYSYHLMGKHKRKTKSQKYKLREGSFKRSLRYQLNQAGEPLFIDGNIDALDIRSSDKLSQPNRRSS
tara:strand:+ start:7288 stop:7617 length:330 start_codon:yes stop_codon:yes gene_type:complete